MKPAKAAIPSEYLALEHHAFDAGEQSGESRP
jgi:hypothetical protein